MKTTEENYSPFKRFKVGQIISYTLNGGSFGTFIITGFTEDSVVCRSLKNNYYYDYMEKVELINLSDVKIIC